MNNKLGNKIRQLLAFGVFLCLVFMNSTAMAQSVDVSGTVTSSEDGTPLPGVSIIVKGTSNGVSSDFDGNYNLNVASDATLVFTFVGFATQEIAVNSQTSINVVLEPSAEALEEVVVTALGIKREEKSLGYSVETVESEELTRVAQENVLNSMSGKVAGVTINNTGGAGSSVSMVIRGATSISNDNQPLFIIDGVPVQSSVNNVGGFGDDNRVDYGNAISDLDPESIENVSILKGPSAAALYGQRAGNGVVLITTKKAKEGEKTSVTITSNTVFDIPSKFINASTGFSTGFFSFRPENIGGGLLLPPVNPSDGTGSGPENDQGYWAVQWDAELDANGNPIPTELVSYPNNIENFLNDYAYTTTNGVSISSSENAVNYRLGYTNMNHKGLIPNSDLQKNNVSLAASSKLWDKVTVSSDMNFSNSWADNRPASNRGANPLQAAYFHPTNIDIRKLRDYNIGGDDILRVSGNHENPYFLAHEVNNSFNRYRFYGNATINWEISPSFSLMGRYALNKSDEVRESKVGVGYQKEPNNGTYGIRSGDFLERNMDMLLTYNKSWEDFNLTASVGGNNMYSKSSYITNSSRSGLIVPNVFTVQNINSQALNYRNERFEEAIYSVYGLANLDYKSTLFLDVTHRIDWSSTLPGFNNEYPYSSASLSILVDQVFNLGNNVSMFKLRGGIAGSGNDTKPYNLLNTYVDAGQWGDATRLTKQGKLLNANLKPEDATSMEFGTDLKLFSNRLRFEGTYYTMDNVNQIFGVPIPVTSGNDAREINAGLLQSSGWEFSLGGTPIKNQNWSWDIDVNITQNETVIKELADGVEFVKFWGNARVDNIGYAENAAAGHDGLTGNLYARETKRVTDQNSEYYGYPILGSGLDAEWEGEEELSKIGNYNPDFIMGLQSSLKYKNFSLNMTFDWRSGGQYVSQTFRYMSESVLTQTWLDELVHPGDLGGAASQELRDWVVENEDQLLLGDKLRPVGGPTPEYGGFPESFSGVTVYDGTFAPGVMGHHDENGNFILEKENLGNEGTTFLPYVVSYPWDIGRANMFDADYVKLREIALGYTLPSEVTDKWGIQNVNFSVYSRNIMLWTKDSKLGVDPERAFQAEASGRFSQGVERYNVNPWVVPIGFKAGFTF